MPVMESLNSTATNALRALLDTQPTSEAKVAFAWQIAAGPVLGRAASTAWSADGLLRVSARTDAWREEIRRARPVILERMRHLLGPEVVRRFVIDSDDEPRHREARDGQERR
jgi:Dna[CI] antecedent DciA-like protein